MRALVIDDHTAWQEVLAANLEAIGFQVDTATDLAGAIKLLGRHTYQLVVLDMVLDSASSGRISLEWHAFVQRLRREHANLPVVVITGHLIDPAEAFIFPTLGVVDVISKQHVLLNDLSQRFDRFIRAKDGTHLDVEARRPLIFIGHGGRSKLWRELKEYIEEFEFDVETFETTPRFGEAATDVIKAMLARADFAFLIHTGEDETAHGKVRARQNVVHETGLFQGRLGFKRVIVIREEGVESFSNLDGQQEIRFPPGNIREAFGDVARTLTNIFPTL